TAALAAPALTPLVDRYAGNHERSRWIEPPETEERISEQPEEHGSGEVGAEQVLRSLAAGRDRAERVRESPLRDAEEGIATTLEETSPMPIQLVSGCSLVTSLWIASAVT
ncbi:MAG: hypothetical protein ACRD3V_15000, partial [Vicinamibacteria bacterium]